MSYTLQSYNYVHDSRRVYNLLANYKPNYYYYERQINLATCIITAQKVVLAPSRGFYPWNILMLSTVDSVTSMHENMKSKRRVGSDEY